MAIRAWFNSWPVPSSSAVTRLRQETLSAYRWQYILSGASEPRFQKVLRSMITTEQLERIEKALAPIAATATVQA